jgi:hypothetical protein
VSDLLGGGGCLTLIPNLLKAAASTCWMAELMRSCNAPVHPPIRPSPTAGDYERFPRVARHALATYQARHCRWTGQGGSSLVRPAHAQGRPQLGPQQARPWQAQHAAVAPVSMAQRQSLLKGKGRGERRGRGVKPHAQGRSQTMPWVGTGKRLHQCGWS